MFRAVHGVPGNQCLLSPVAAVSTGEIRQSNIDLQGAYASAVPAVVETRGARALRLWSNQREVPHNALGAPASVKTRGVPGVRPQRGTAALRWLLALVERPTDLALDSVHLP